MPKRPPADKAKGGRRRRTASVSIASGRGKSRDLDAYAVRSLDEVAAMLIAQGLHITRSGVWATERRALKKLFEALIDYAPVPDDALCELASYVGGLRSDSPLPRYRDR